MLLPGFSHAAAPNTSSDVVVIVREGPVQQAPFGGTPAESGAPQPPSEPSGPSGRVVVESVEQPPAEERQENLRTVTVGDGQLPVRVVRQGQARSADITAAGTAPSSGDRNPSPAPRIEAFARGSEVGLWVPRYKATYAWRAEPFLSPETRAATLDAIARNKFGRLLIAFEDGETERLKTDEGERQLQDLLSGAADMGLVVDLLLGPEVLSRNGKETLQEKLAVFRPFAFNAIHLYVGSDSLPAERILETLETVVASVRRPIGVTLPPQYMEGISGKSAAGAFYRMNLDEVAIALCSTDADAVVDRFQRICRAYPELPFSLAQSVDSARPRTESYFTTGVPIFGRRMQKLCFDTSAENALDLIVDPWESFLEMDY